MSRSEKSLSSRRSSGSSRSRGSTTVTVKTVDVSLPKKRTGLGFVVWAAGGRLGNTVAVRRSDFTEQFDDVVGRDSSHRKRTQLFFVADPWTGGNYYEYDVDDDSRKSHKSSSSSRYSSGGPPRPQQQPSQRRRPPGASRRAPAARPPTTAALRTTDRSILSSRAMTTTAPSRTCSSRRCPCPCPPRPKCSTTGHRPR